jgi:rRNA maturation RNase YbeY
LVKNLQVFSEDKSINLRRVHSLISKLKSEFDLNILFLSISFISSEELKKINKYHLKHNYDTDIITFDYSEKEKEIDGEILISYQQAKINSIKYKVSYSHELNRLVIHGVLHLLDYDDNNKKNKTIMKQMENKLINRYNFALLAGR